MIVRTVSTTSIFVKPEPEVFTHRFVHLRRIESCLANLPHHPAHFQRLSYDQKLVSSLLDWPPLLFHAYNLRNTDNTDRSTSFASRLGQPQCQSA
jgi:hypothetical protein